MLKKINAGRVESDSGFSVHITGLECLRYQEGDKFVDIDWTYNQKLRKLSVYTDSINKWDNPPGKELTTAEKEIMNHNIDESLKLLKGNFEII